MSRGRTAQQAHLLACLTAPQQLTFLTSVTDVPLEMSVSAIHPPTFEEMAMVSHGSTANSPDDVRFMPRTWRESRGIVASGLITTQSVIITHGDGCTTSSLSFSAQSSLTL